MIKRIFVFCMYLFSLSTFAYTNILFTAPSPCTDALPTDNKDFCPSFRSAATCYCASSGLPQGMCLDMTALYNRMISVFGSLQKACEYQRYTTTQDCIDNWTCYRSGGIDSHGRICHACN
jgi:hypothetical protein